MNPEDIARLITEDPDVSPEQRETVDLIFRSIKDYLKNNGIDAKWRNSCCVGPIEVQVSQNGDTIVIGSIIYPPHLSVGYAHEARGRYTMDINDPNSFPQLLDYIRNEIKYHSSK